MPCTEASKEHIMYTFTAFARPSYAMQHSKYSIDDLEEWDFRIRNHADMESYNAWMEELQGRALYYAEPDHAPASIVTLATCDRWIHGKKGRFLVIAGKVAG